MPQIREITRPLPVAPANQSTVKRHRRPPKSTTVAPTDQSVVATRIQPTYADILVRLIQGRTITVVVGTSPDIKVYNTPISLLRWHSTWFNHEIDRQVALTANTEVNKKRKISTEQACTPVIKAEGDQVEHDSSVAEAQAKAQAHNNTETMVIHLEGIDPKDFELFMQYIYMGSYPVKSQDSGLTAGTDPQQRQYSAVPQSQEPVAGGGMAAPFVPTLRIPPGPASHTLPSNSIPSSIRAWLLGWRLKASHFVNYSMLKIYEDLGNYIFLAPDLVRFIWQRTNPDSALRHFVIDVLTVYWAEAEPCRPYINRDPALDQQWMQFFDTLPNLKSAIMLGMRYKKQMPALQAYFVNVQGPKVPLASPETRPETDAATNAPEKTIQEASGEGQGKSGMEGRVVNSETRESDFLPTDTAAKESTNSVGANSK